MFSRIVRLAGSMLLALVPIVVSAAIAASVEPPTQPGSAWMLATRKAGNVSSQFDAAGRSPADFSSRVFDVERPSGIVRRPALRPLAAGAPQTITVQVVPNTLIANSGATATITATVYDVDNNVVAGAILTGSITPGRGSVGSFPLTDVGGQARSSWTALAGAGSTVGTGTILVFTDAVTGSASITLTAGSPATLTLSPATTVITAGQRIAYTAIATDAFGNPLGNVTGSTAFSVAPAPGAAFVGNAITPTVKGTYSVTGTNGAVGSAALGVNPNTFSRLSIENAPNGTGTPINAYAMSVYDTLAAYAVGYDVYSNTIGSQAANWGGTGVVVGRLTPTTNSISTTLKFTTAVSGTGTITATSGGSGDATGSITVQTPVLRISKSDSPDPVTPGTQLHYTIRYTNTSTFDAQGVVITETYPLSTTFNHASPAPAPVPNVWSFPSLAAGAGGTIDVYVDVAPQMPVGSVLTNTVRIGASQGATDIYTATTPVNAQPILGADVVDSSDPVRPGQEFVYTIQYRNDGNAPATGLRITETYPSQVTYVSANPSPSVSNNVWQTNTLNGGGTSRLILVTVRVKSPAADGTLMNNQVTIDSNETAPFTVAETTQVAAPMLQLTKSANPVAPTANSLLTYTLRYTNSGTSDLSYASNVVVTDAVPLNTVFQSCTPDCSVNGSIVTWNLGQLLQQTSDALTLAVRINNNLPNGTILTNTARIASTELAAAFGTLTNIVSSAPNVSLSKSDGVTSAGAGDVLTYQLSYTNTGNTPAQNVVITDRIPANVGFVGCTACTGVGGVYTFTLGTVNAAQGGVVTLSVRVNSPLQAGVRAITNTAYIRTSSSGDNPADNGAQDVDSISTVPVVTLTVAYDAKTPYPGKTITYTLRYTNTSLMNTTGVVISTTRAPYVTVKPTGWVFGGGNDTYTVGNLGAGQAGTINYVVVLTSTFTPATKAFSNTFLIHDGGPGGLPVAQAQRTAFIGVPDLSIERVIVPASVVPNERFTVTVIISNAGLGRACNPSNCGGFYVDAFVDPAESPPSYPYLSDGDPFAVVPPVSGGLTATVLVTNISFTPAQRPWLYFKVDNFDCSPPGGADPCLPSHSLGGLVPEYNENNNVYPPDGHPLNVPRYAVYLPLVRKNWH